MRTFRAVGFFWRFNEMKTNVIPNIIIPNFLSITSFHDLFLSKDNVETKIQFHYRYQNEYKWLTDAIRGNNNELDDVTLFRVIETWCCEIPVIISAQTGYGKNMFVSRTLVKKIFTETGYKRKILILSNRIALSRQNKIDYLDFLYNLTHDTYFKKIAEKFSETGLDNFIDFKIVTICSYQQLYEMNIKKTSEENLINLEKFFYVVCDECHFFTSDALFNTHTDEILEYIVENAKNAVRIYMSATVENVFEPLLRAESKFANEKFTNAKNLLQLSNPDQVDKLNIAQAISRGEYQWTNNVSDVIENRQNNIAEAIEKTRQHLYLSVEFYYVSRNYSYIENIFEYNTLTEVLSLLAKSQDKNLIFISKTFSSSDEKEISEIFKTDNKTVAFLSREKINTNAQCKSIYNKIISDKKFDEDVLITTSVLDNGIDLKDSSICNVVIDVPDRTEFLQMLGRVRVSDNQKINLFVPKYDVNSLKKIFEQKIQHLITILYMETLPADKQHDFFEYIATASYKYGSVMNKFKITRNSEQPYAYNQNAVYQLISSATELLKLIKHTEPNYVANLADEDKDRLYTVRKYYIEGDGRNKTWSRRVIDLIETDEGILERKKAVYNASRFTTPEEHMKIVQDYEIKFNEDFWHFLCHSLIPRYFNNKIENTINSLKGFAGIQFDRKTYGVIEPIKKLQILKEILQNTLPFDISREESFNKSIIYYKNLTDDSEIFTSSEMMMTWIEKNSLNDISKFGKLNTNLNYVDENTPFQIFSISVEEFNKHTETYEDGKKLKCISNDFLQKYGIEKDSEKHRYTSQTYFNGKSFSQYPKALIQDKQCIIKSALRAKDKKTFYFIVYESAI